MSDTRRAEPLAAKLWLYCDSRGPTFTATQQREFFELPENTADNQCRRLRGLGLVHVIDRTPTIVMRAGQP